MTISVPDAEACFQQFHAEEQERFKKYLRTYEAKEEKRDRGKRTDDRGCLHSGWRPEQLASRNVLVIGENGIGDEILTVACLAELKQYCQHVVWRCDAKLKVLFQRAFPDVEFISHDDPTPKTDGTIYSWELIKHFRDSLDKFPWTASGKFSPYLKPGFVRTTTLTAHYQSGSLPLIGLAWRSEAVGPGKTCDLKSVSGWRTFFDELRNRVRFVSLQSGDTEDDINFARWKYGVEIYQDQSIDTLNDLDGVAAQVAALNHVVSISTAVVHLAGALGACGWVLLPHNPFAHWKAGKNICPWYPTVRPVRQESPAGWNTVLEKVAKELAAKIV